MANSMTDAKDEYSKDEAQRRFEQALRGAQLAEPSPMKDVPPKRSKKQEKRPKKDS